MEYVKQLLYYPFLILLRSISSESNIYNLLLEMLTKFGVEIIGSLCSESRNAITEGGMPPDPPSKERLQRSIVNRASNVHQEPLCKKAGYALVSENTNFSNTQPLRENDKVVFEFAVSQTFTCSFTLVVNCTTKKFYLHALQ